jgi:hypothetical protein
MIGNEQLKVNQSKLLVNLKNLQKFVPGVPFRGVHTPDLEATEL